MIIPWRRSRKEKFRSRSENANPLLPVVEFRSAVLLPSIRGLNVTMNANSWVVLSGADELGIALFCDLCFNFVQPEEGEVTSKYTSKDVSIIGRSATTYGSTIWEHITCGASQVSKVDVINLARLVLRDSIFQSNLKEDEYVQLLHNPISDFELSERSWLEISELNALLQGRNAVVIDTSSSFYSAALSYGFQHSKVFLMKPLLFLWIVNNAHELPKKAMPWTLKEHSEKIIELSFSNESHPKYIN